MPTILQVVEELEQQRIEDLKVLLTHMVKSQQLLSPSLSQICETMFVEVESINPTLDIETFSKLYATGKSLDLFVNHLPESYDPLSMNDNTNSLEEIELPKVRALFDYTSSTEHELSFKANDIITVLQKDDSGWWQGEIETPFQVFIGIFPSNYTEIVDPTDLDEQNEDEHSDTDENPNNNVEETLGKNSPETEIETERTTENQNLNSVE